MTDFGRVLTAMVTPFKQDGAVDYAVAEKLADHLIRHGTDTLVVCGTTGESPALTWSEEYQLFTTMKKIVGDRAKIIAGTGSNSTAEAVEATQKAAKLGVDGTLQVVPYYNKPPQAGLKLHFSSIAYACPQLPLMLYNVPGRTGCNLQPETVAALSEIENVVAIKEASGSLEQVSQIRKLTPAAFQIYSGDDSLTLPMLAVGAYGVVSVASHLVGDRLQAMIQAFVSGQTQTATQIHLELFPLFKGLFMTTNPIPVKAALNQVGWPVGGLRAPLPNASESVVQQVKQILAEVGLTTSM